MQPLPVTARTRRRGQPGETTSTLMFRVREGCNVAAGEEQRRSDRARWSWCGAFPPSGRGSSERTDQPRVGTAPQAEAGVSGWVRRRTWMVAAAAAIVFAATYFGLAAMMEVDPSLRRPAATTAIVTPTPPGLEAQTSEFPTPSAITRPPAADEPARRPAGAPETPDRELPPFDPADLIFGGAGSEGAILAGPGIVASSGQHARTPWELLIPSARLRAAIVAVGLTPTNALGAPDNPNVIGWWVDGPAPGEVGKRPPGRPPRLQRYRWQRGDGRLLAPPRDGRGRRDPRTRYGRRGNIPVHGDRDGSAYPWTPTRGAPTCGAVSAPFSRSSPARARSTLTGAATRTGASSSPSCRMPCPSTSGAILAHRNLPAPGKLRPFIRRSWV